MPPDPGCMTGPYSLGGGGGGGPGDPPSDPQGKKRAIQPLQVEP